MKPACLSLLLLGALSVTAQSAAAQTQPASKVQQQPKLPYTPSLDLSAMDRTENPCHDFYRYACGGWQKKNPIPNDQVSWSVYEKLYQDNLAFLRGILEQVAASSQSRTKPEQEVGDFYQACMDAPAIEKRGIGAVKPQLDEIARLQSTKGLAPVIADLQTMYARSILFRAGSDQDPDDAEAQIAALDQGGLGLPDRDYYTKDDTKSDETRVRYIAHVEKLFELMGEPAAAAKQDAATVMRMETALAKASLTRVERRNPYNLKHKMTLADVEKLAPNFDWGTYYHDAHYPQFAVINVATPDFLKQVNAQISLNSLANWKTYLRFHVVNSASPYLSAPFADEYFEFYLKYLRGAKAQQPRWKRCVSYADDSLGDALGQIYVARVFSPQLRQDARKMIVEIEDAMAQRIQQLDWMSPATKQQALAKLHAIRNKIGYPDKWKDYSSVKITRDDFAGDVARATQFEVRRNIDKVGKPVDHSEWDMTATTVDAYYNDMMNDINFPAAVLQPPLYDPKMDAAPNYGNTGGTMGHELTHAFDDEGSQFDAHGNLKNWWTKEDRTKFDAHTKCVRDQYAEYVVTDNVHINSSLTLGEDIADLGGEILGYLAWQADTKGQDLKPIDGLTPEQRFFIGFAQWDCANERPEDLRVRAITDPHSPPVYRINGVVVNMPEFAHAFSCKAGDPMVKPKEKVCKVW